MISSDYLNKQLAVAEYEESIGIRIAHLAKTSVGGVDTELIIVKLDPGKALIPHLHEVDGEIWIPLTKGSFILGDAKTDKSDGKYIYEGEKVVVDWDVPFAAEIGKSFEVPAGKAHFFKALPNEEMLVFIIVPSEHLKDDKKFVTHPN